MWFTSWICTACVCSDKMFWVSVQPKFQNLSSNTSDLISWGRINGWMTLWVPQCKLVCGKKKFIREIMASWFKPKSEFPISLFHSVLQLCEHCVTCSWFQSCSSPNLFFFLWVNGVTLNEKWNYRTNTQGIIIKFFDFRIKYHNICSVWSSIEPDVFYVLLQKKRTDHELFSIAISCLSFVMRGLTFCKISKNKKHKPKSISTLDRLPVKQVFIEWAIHWDYKSKLLHDA